MKRTILLIAIALTGSCKQEPENVQRMEELLHGDWYGVEVTNHLIAQGLWDTLHPHSITDLIGTFDTFVFINLKVCTTIIVVISKLFC